jgi:hypothetical protein
MIMNVIPLVDDEANARDLYLAVKAARSAEYNRRVCAHEIGHAYVARACGSFVEFVTAVPHGDFAGRCVRRGAPSSSLNLVDERKPAPTTEQIVDICEAIGPLEIGTPRVKCAEEITRAQTMIIELVAGNVCERVFFPDHEPLPAEHDLAEARALASVTCASPSALLRFAELEAETLIRAHLSVVTALIDDLIERGTLTGDEVDWIISAAVALETERCRRADWRARELAANSFQIECGHVNVASLPRSTPDRVG